MKHIVVDAEANHLLEKASRIHVVCVYLPEEDEVLSFLNTQWGEFKRFIYSLKESPKVVGHNLIGYDLPLFRKILGIPYSIGNQDDWGTREVEFIDTFHLSQFLNADRNGGHSLDNLARLAGSHKDEYNGGFEEYSREMHAYCIQDVKATWEVYKMLVKEAENKYEN